LTYSYRVQNFQTDGSTYYLYKHILPDAAEPGAALFYDSSGQLLYNPEWILGAKYSHDFIDAVVAAVRVV
jgi:hypothetical protein